MSHLGIAWARLRRSRRATVGAVVLGTVALLGVFADVLASEAPLVAVGRDRVAILPALLAPGAHAGKDAAGIRALYEDDLALYPPVRSGPSLPTEAGPHASPSLEHPLGTDAQGRDLAARVIYGARTALGLSLFAVLASMLLGVALGGLAAYYRGFWNDRLVRLVETVDTFPAIIVVALVRAIEVRPTALSLVLAVALVRWAEVARLVRASVLQASTEDWVVAARALGASPARVFFRHIAPNAVGPVIVSSVFGVASIVLLEAAVAFLGMGGETASASWGETLAEGARDPSHPGLILVPGLALLLTVGGTYLLADALRDALDPRTLRRAEGPGEASPLSVVREPMG